MQHEKLRAWIAHAESQALFINGNGDGGLHTSPISFVCSKLIDSIRPDSVKSVPSDSIMDSIFFFCGEHLSRTDPDARPTGMMRSLIAQLLLIYPDFDLRVVRRLRKIDSDSADDLSKIFMLLMDQIPPQSVLFCIVDGLTYYEDTKSQTSEAEMILGSLLDAVDRSIEAGWVFKLLLTSPNQSRILYRDIPQENVVWLPSKVSSQGGFTSLKWEAGIGRNF